MYQEFGDTIDVSSSCYIIAGRDADFGRVSSVLEASRMKSITSKFRSLIRFATELLDRPESASGRITSKFIGLI
jgi:hypothetical protein